LGVGQLGFTVRLAEGRILDEMVAEAAHMRHQVTQQDRANRSDQTSVGLKDLHAAKSWNVFRHRLDQPEASFFEQRHERNADDRFGHRVQAEDCVRGHRLARLLVAPAELARVHDFAATGDQRIDPRVDAAIDVSLHRRSDALEALSAHSGRFRRFDCVIHISSVCG
jgi:hypothetical protein